MTSLIALFEALADYLASREPLTEYRAAFAGAAGRTVAGPRTSVGTWIPAALAGVADDDALFASVRAAEAGLCWRQNASYRDTAFLAGYAYCELLGPTGHAREAALSAGLLCLRPGIHYPAHAHPAHEVYHLLCGRSLWQRGDEPWIERRAHSRIEHPSGVPHAMRALTEPLLALYLWRGEIDVAAALIDQ